MSYLSILIASLLGSPHCALMCGSFAGISAQSRRPRLTQLCYHTGRLITYSTLGIISGFAGKSINSFSSQFGVANFAAILCGASLIASALFNLFGKNISHVSFIPFKLFNSLNRYLAKAENKSPFIILSMGVFSTLLPCGWLYTYLALAAATGSSYQGLFLMFFFWIGTLPVLLSVGELSNILSASIKKRVPLIVSVLILIAGFLTIKNHLLPQNHEKQSTQHLICG